MHQNTVTLTFYGAAGTVTGSRYLLENAKSRLLIDCGLFQGYKYLREKNWQDFPVPPSSIQAVILTHAHLDHSGYIPALVKQGFKGPIICTQATRDLCEVLLLDSAHIQEEEARYRNRHRTSKHHPALPLYTVKEAKQALKLFEPVNALNLPDSENIQYEAFKQGDLTVNFHPNGHILGSTYLEIVFSGRRIIFSGDMGRPNDLVMRPPQPPCGCDYLIIESTYGNRTHPQKNTESIVEDIILNTVKRGGSILVPVFAVGRAQVMMYLLQQLRAKGKIPFLPIYLDSPMAIHATEIMMRHHNLHRLSSKQCHELSTAIIFTPSVEESMALNNITVPSIILSASGMATGGRVLHHLKRMLGNYRNTIMFAGYQAGGTRGARLVDGAQQVKIHGSYYAVNAQIEDLGFMSAHADRDELLLWLKKLPAPPKRCFITHGEASAADDFRCLVNNELGWNSHVASIGESVKL